MVAAGRDRDRGQRRRLEVAGAGGAGVLHGHAGGGDRCAAAVEQLDVVVGEDGAGVAACAVDLADDQAGRGGRRRGGDDGQHRADEGEGAGDGRTCPASQGGSRQGTSFGLDRSGSAQAKRCSRRWEGRRVNGRSPAACVSGRLPARWTAAEPRRLAPRPLATRPRATARQSCPRSEVTRRWQLAHRTSHFAISRLDVAPPPARATMDAMSARFSTPGRWSNSRTRTSLSPQSTQGCARQVRAEAPLVLPPTVDGPAAGVGAVRLPVRRVPGPRARAAPGLQAVLRRRAHVVVGQRAELVAGAAPLRRVHARTVPPTSDSSWWAVSASNRRPSN